MNAEKRFRELKIERKAIEEESRTVDLTISSEEPYERSFGIEVLDHGDGSADQTAEAMATLTLVKEGFEVSLPVFLQPSFDLIAKWGQAVHPIQIKSGQLNENGKSVQWHTAKTPKANGPSRLYSEADCSYFGLVLIPFEEICWIPVSETGGRTSICTNIEKDMLAIYRGNTEGLKKWY